MSELKKNDIITLDVSDINNLGCGVSHLEDGRVIFVRGAVTGERIKARIIKINSDFAVGRLEEIICSSDIRAEEDPCEAAESCGGCVFRHVGYDYEKKIKKSYVQHAFLKAGLPCVVINDVHSTDKIFGYRNKAQYPFAKTADGVRAGFYALRSHNVIAADSCALQPEIFGDILRYVCDFATEAEWSVYDENNGKGLLRHLYLRAGERTGEIMLCLVVNGDKLPREQTFAERVKEKFPSIESIIINKNIKNTNVVLGKENRVLLGKAYIEDILCGVRFRITPESFYQVNHDGAELLYGLARERAVSVSGDKVSLLDMYCGIGTIGLSMADAVSELTGIEIVEGAVECARINAEMNGVNNARFFAGDATDVRSLFESVEKKNGKLAPDVVILDPPRKGCSAEVVDFLAERGIKKIVYVSCNPDTLARDCARFAELGYDIGEVDPVDMFPRTAHVESVVCLEREQK